MNETMNTTPNQEASRRQQGQDSRNGTLQNGGAAPSANGGRSLQADAGARELQSGEQSGSQNESMRTVLPAVDIVEDETGITVLADLPGVSRDRLGIKVTGDNLQIEGAAQVPVSGDMELLYGEVQSLQYRRSFTLSRELDPAKIEAKLTNGVLRLRIPKAEEARPRRIEVSVG